MRVDLNADVGEGPSGRGGQDAVLIRHITSANIACGFHAGDAAIMRATVQLARDNGVAVGAHPSFPDIEGFGRRELQFSPRDVEDFVAFQVGALAAIAAAEGVRLQHLKPHGALFNMAARDAALADAIARAAVVIDATLMLFGPPDSELAAAAARAGLRFAAEGFADRAYHADGRLVSRDQAWAVIDDPETVVRRAVRMICEQTIETIDGTSLPVVIDTICVHGDTPGAADLAARIRAGLTDAGVEVRPLPPPPARA